VQHFSWARPRGLLNEPDKHRLFGFNNPNPSPGSPNYGYEVWIMVNPETEPEEVEKILDFNGGLYAVTQCVVQKGNFDGIGDTWKKPVAWHEDSKYQCSPQQ